MSATVNDGLAPPRPAPSVVDGAKAVNDGIVSLERGNPSLTGEYERDVGAAGSRARILPSLTATTLLSPPAVAERLRRLEDSGAIAGYRADVDPRALGYALGAIVRVRPAPRQIPKVADVARDTPEVVECHRVTGEDCFFVKVHVRDVEHLEEVIDRFTPFGQTTTSIVQSSPVPPRGIDVS